MLKDTINADLKAAMLARDSLKTQTLQGLKSVILYEEVAKKIRETGLDDAQIEQLIAREVKKRDEAAELFERGGNQASADKERAEKEILSRYLPAQISEDELKVIVETTIAELKAEGAKDMGRVIGAVKTKVGNTADGALVARLTKSALES
ncbi:MAG TPA: GatB/YqeY domain-containing protein [Candidatus Saccharibacteria bacterium]|nr:GatB/YqeY domain-containing protein [Candidatus Saccharibacteria bacterium]